MALSFTSGIIIPFSYFVHVQEWLEATGHKKEIVDLEIAKHKKQWNCTSTPSEPDCGLQVLATGSHPISYPWQAKHTNLLDRKSHYNLLWLLDSFALRMSGADNTQLTNQHINNNKQHINNTNNNIQTTHKQQHTNTSHSSKAPGEPLYNHAGHSFFCSSLVTSILHHHRLPL